ncbi:MAG TPA: nucleotidyl transferase AbiEii/AbiGii toxin family protein [Elusimicrobiota bacterium]|nr:nucleotidyl transferase AbiEii/AbiGii toxin family protein [Elusimicrobiota bacterium]
MAEEEAYATVAAFRRALENRLRNRAQSEGLDLTRLYRMVAFERFLGRVCADDPPMWLLKGGYAMEVRLRMEARATKDVDLSLPDGSLITTEGQADVDRLLERLRIVVARDLRDGFVFKIGDPIRDVMAAPYGGWRFQVESRLADRRFAEFKLDVGIGDAIVSAPEWMPGHDLLSFANIPPVRIALLPREQHFAEKIHAYTVPREATNSRVRDLVDLVLLIQKGLPETATVARAVDATFIRRKTHAVPAVLPAPPVDWAVPYQKIADEVGVVPAEIRAAFEIVREYWTGIKFEGKE